MYCNLQILPRVVIIIALLVASCCFISCKKKEEAPAPASIPASADRAAPAPAGGPGTPKEESVPQVKKRKVILNHSINLEVKEFPVALEALTKLAESSGGYVFKSNRNSHDKNSKKSTHLS